MPSQGRRMQWKKASFSVYVFAESHSRNSCRFCGCAVWSLSEFVSLCPVLLARAAAAASAARHPRPAGGAYLPELRFRLGDFRSEERAFGHTELAGHLLSFKTQSRAEGLPALRPLVGDMVGLPVLHEHGAGLDEVEGHAVGAALEAERLHPLEMAGARPVVVLPAAEHLLDESRGEVILRVERTDERGRHESPVLRRGAKEDRESLVSPPLVLRRDAEHHVLVALAPIGREALGEPLRTLGEKKEEHVRTLPDDLPRLFSPRVGLLDEEVRRQAHVQGRAGPYAETAVTPALQGQVEVLRAEDARGVDAPSGVEEVHIAVLAAFADLAAAVPGVPDDHRSLSLSYPIIFQNPSGSVTFGSLEASLKSGAISLSLQPAIPQPMGVTRKVSSGCSFA